MDAIDAALLRIDKVGIALEDYQETPYPAELRTSLEAVVRTEQATLKSLGRLHVAVGAAFADATAALLRRTRIPAEAIIAIGSHGQTLMHQPDGDFPFSMQIGDPSVIAQRTGIATVADFRSMDLAAGGQGAPLVPGFHHAAFGKAGEDRAILNIGGVANLSLLYGGGRILGFDTGPGNTLLDGWIARYGANVFDEAGRWARSGQCNPELLQSLLADPYFVRRPPKSTGRDYFNETWLRRALDETVLPPADVQCTLTHLSVQSIVDALRQHMPDCRLLAVCGGGGRNEYLLELLAKALASVRVVRTDDLGIPADAVEACAFAWLAARRLTGAPGNVPDVTGAQAPCVLGGVYAPVPGRA